jgi:plastocyanin
LTVRVGDTVTFVNRDPYVPHTITFGPEPPGAPESLIAPYGNPTHFDGTAPLNSGFLYPPFPFGTQFSVTFTASGTYDFICGIHDTMGMVGSVTVMA